MCYNISMKILSPVGNIESLKIVLIDISSIVYMIYTKDSIEPLLAKYNEGIVMLENRSTQEEIDLMVVELTTLKSNLLIDDNRQLLYNTLLEYSNINLSEYSTTKANEFQSSYDYAIQVLNSLDSTDVEINNAIYNVNQAYENLDSSIFSSTIFWVILVILIIVVIVVVCCMRN